jgi:hypothetical protein
VVAELLCAASVEFPIGCLTSCVEVTLLLFKYASPIPPLCCDLIRLALVLKVCVLLVAHMAAIPDDLHSPEYIP